MEADVRQILAEARRVDILTRHDSAESLTGSYHSAFKGSGIEFEEVRAYVPGDDVRAIDWNVTARNSEPFIKRYREERELNVMLLVDVSASQAFGSKAHSKRYEVARMAAVIAYSALSNHDKVGLMLFAGEPLQILPPRGGQPHLPRIVHDILHAPVHNGHTDMATALERYNQVLRKRCITFLLSDFILPQANSETLNAKLAQTARRHDLIAIEVCDPREETLPNVGWVMLRDAETGELRSIDTGRSATRKAYEDNARRLRQSNADRFKRLGIDHFPINAGERMVDGLRACFAKRERRR